MTMRKNVLVRENRGKLGGAEVSEGLLHNEGEHSIDFKKGQIRRCQLGEAHACGEKCFC